MPQYDDTNRWILFKNERKENDKHADYSGTLNVDGREFWINGWVREGAKGKFFSGSIKAKESLREAAAPKQTVTSGKYDPLDDGDSIPF